MSKDALVVKASFDWDVIDIQNNELKALQGAVDGLIQPIDLADDVTLWVNEEYLLRSELELNALATEIYSAMIGRSFPIYGDVVFTGGNDAMGNTLGLDLQVNLSIQDALLSLRQDYEEFIED